jgi:hypothetical protein
MMGAGNIDKTENRENTAREVSIVEHVRIKTQMLRERFYDSSTSQFDSRQK